MPTPAHAAEPKNETTDTPQPDGSWYSAFTGAPEPVQNQPSEPVISDGGHAYPDLLATLTPSDIPGPHTRRVDAPLQVLLNLKHAELDRMVRENERLMDRIDTLLQIQEREQVLRQQLQNQVERIKLESPPADLDAVRREARAGVTEELKPVLLAILDALERFVRKPDATPMSTDTAATADPLLFEDYGKLPAILTRPLDELVEDGGDPGRSGSGAKKQRPRKMPFRNRKRPRAAIPDPEPAAGPGPFTWTTVFSS